MENRIAGAVVLYNPEYNCINNINSYLSQVSLLCVIDNSEKQNIELVNELISNPKVKYVENKSNFGVAQALNQAARTAINNNYDFLLTMDQDSIADDQLVENYVSFLSNNRFNVGILAPAPVYIKGIEKKDSVNSKEVNVAITSGSLLNLIAFEKVGEFNKGLFIDYVDFEYCLRLKESGFKILQLNDAIIFHSLGNIERRRFLFKQVFITHHSPERIYYRTRNRLYVAWKYINVFPLFVGKDFLLFFNEILKIIFFEKGKILKIKMIMLGIRDWIKNKYGKLENI
jgi:rhamnosyltransferase